MDNPICVSCHKGLALEEIERGNFKHIGGRLYCGECVAKMRRVGPVPCPECGATDTPLYTGSGYQCRKCGAALKPPAQAAAGRPAAQPQRPRLRAPAKPCPYCGATILAEALKCRYCGASLTREARDLEVFSRQNSQLRFWVGCLLSASIFLILFLLYTLAVRRPQPEAVQPAPAVTPAAKPDANADLIRELREELRGVRGQLVALEADQKRLAAKASSAAALTPLAPFPKALVEAMRPPAPKIEGVATPKAAPEKDRPAPKEPAEKAPKEPVPPTKVASVGPPSSPSPKSPIPAPSEVVKVEPPKEKQDERTAAQLATAAFPVFSTELDKLKAARRFGDALAACRQFLAAHLGTPEADKVQAAQKALREQLEAVRDDHARRFKDALEKRNVEAARRTMAELAQYQAPEIAEDQAQMLAALKAIEQQPTLDVAKYLTQWETPPAVARFLQELKAEKDWTLRSRAAKELGRVAHRAAIKGLIEALQDQEFYVKVCAINALSDIGDPIALPALAPLTKASFPVIYDAAAKAIRTLAAAPRDKFADAWKLLDPKAIAKELAEALKVQDKEDSPATSRYQIALIETLGLLDAKDTAPVIRPMVEKAKDPAVRKAAADAIKKLTGESLLPEPPAPPKAEPPKEAPKTEPPKEAPKAPAPPKS